MLLGEYEHALDDKNRLTLPAKFREAFSHGVFVAKGIDPCLVVYPPGEWDQFVEQGLAPLNPFSREARQMSRFMFAGATDTELDRQGRIMIPQPLVEHAKLDREVVVAGVRDHLEIWDRAAWREQLKEVEGSAELVAERLAAHS
ncbi:MAG: division/cell wall cluster transcriptional repressor MraZ [Actinobacteria bacterium]|nr:division/cell wall cluster transcriptional repressor MraZ [Actinomycetota bacterium]